MVPHLVHERPAQDLAVFGDRLVREHADDAAVIDLDAPAEVVADIHAPFFLVSL